MAFPADVVGRHETGRRQAEQVPADGGPADGVVRREVDHPRRAGDELREESAADRVGQGLEGVHTPYW